MPEFSDLNELLREVCVCRRLGTYATCRQMGTEPCRLCGLCVKVLEAFADGDLPALFQGARDEAQRAAILEELFFSIFLGGKQPITMTLYLVPTGMLIDIFRATDENPAFTIEGVSFPFLRSLSGENRDLVVAPVPFDLDRSLHAAKVWLRDCLHHHNCGKSEFDPTRLLDLRKDPIRLFETKDVKSFEGPYVCLSHRWGSPDHTRLTSTVVDVQDHMNGIAWDKIPKTFQDAIAVCRRMSVSYLWIDTLCILQEYDGMSGEDMAKTRADFAAENSAMARIYKNSLFTICASMSTSMDSGIFSTKHDHLIEVTGDDGTDAMLRVVVGNSHDTPPTELESRGWTYQEYLLPPGFWSSGLSTFLGGARRIIFANVEMRGIKAAGAGVKRWSNKLGDLRISKRKLSSGG